MTVVQVLWCTICGGDSDFEQPPCDDGHGFDCPELICVQCSSALVGSWSDTAAGAPLTAAAG
ncbi:MAG: hypothetical protein ACR2KL_06005 [Nocardioidaceae bacterium]